MQRFRTLLVLLLIGNLGLPAWGMRRCCCTQQDETSNQKSCCAGKQVTTASTKPERACCASRAKPGQSEHRSSQALVAEQPIPLCQCVHESAMIPTKTVRTVDSDGNTFAAVTLPLASETDLVLSKARAVGPRMLPHSGLALLSQICRWRI